MIFVGYYFFVFNFIVGDAFGVVAPAGSCAPVVFVNSVVGKKDI